MFSLSLSKLLAAALAAVSVQAAPAALETRQEMSNAGSVATVQWSTSQGNYIRSYHIRNDCVLIENSWNPGSGGWIRNQLPFCANPAYPIAAAKADGPFNSNPEVIQLFFTAYEKKLMKSVAWRSNTGWVEDVNFNKLAIEGVVPMSAVAWRPPPGNDIQIRVYGAQYELYDGPRKVYLDWSYIYEYAWGKSAGWSASNNGGYMFRASASTERTGLSAVVPPDGSSIRLFYFDDEKSLNIFDGTKGQVRQAVYTSGNGWKIYGPQHDSMKNLHTPKDIVAIRWGDWTPSGYQFRVYVRYAEWSGEDKFKEFTGNQGGWYEGQSMPGFALDRFTGGSSAIVWTYPDYNNVHIRVYYPRYHADNTKPYVHEIGYDTGSGWQDMSNLPA